MDVIPTKQHILGPHSESDDSLPDITELLPKKRQNNRPEPSRPIAPSIPDETGRKLFSSQEALTSVNRSGQNSPNGLIRSRQYIQQNMSTTTEATAPRTASALSSNSNERRTAQSLAHVSRGPISSSPRTTNNSKESSNAVVLISSPLSSAESTRAPLHRAKFPSPNLVSTRSSVDKTSSLFPTDNYHEISDDNDEDLKTAIAASLADFHASQRALYIASSSPAPTVPKTSGAFKWPDELLSSSPPSSQTSVTRTAPVQNQKSIAATAVDTPSSQNSTQVRDDVRRILDALDDLAINSLKRKSEDEATPTKKKHSKAKKGSENNKAKKPRKYTSLTQEEKAIPPFIDI